MVDGTDLGPTAATVTIGTRSWRGACSMRTPPNVWLSDELMARGEWPRPVVAVPDVSALIIRVLRIAGDAADLLFVCGGLGFTPDDITRFAVATAFFRDVEVDAAVARRFRRDHAVGRRADRDGRGHVPRRRRAPGDHDEWVPGFRLRNAYVWPGAAGRDARHVPCVDAAGARGADPPSGRR